MTSCINQDYNLQPIAVTFNVGNINYNKVHHYIDTRGIWKVMHIHPYNFTQWSVKKDEGISLNVRILGFWQYHVLMFAFMR